MVTVAISDLSGRTLEQEFDLSDTGAALITAAAVEWELNEKSVKLMSGATLICDDTSIKDILPDDGARLKVQLVKIDAFLELGQLDASFHRGIKVENRKNDSTVWKTSHDPDSNSVFLKRPIRAPCFVEFNVERSTDEISVGVTYNREKVERTSGWSNLNQTCTYIYSKKAAMPLLQWGGKPVKVRGVHGIKQGDLIGMYVDPEEKLLEFYRNCEKVISSADLGVSLPEPDDRDLWAYVMVDGDKDVVSIGRYGPGRPPYPESSTSTKAPKQQAQQQGQQQEQQDPEQDSELDSEPDSEPDSDP